MLEAKAICPRNHLVSTVLQSETSDNHTSSTHHLHQNNILYLPITIMIHESRCSQTLAKQHQQYNISQPHQPLWHCFNSVHLLHLRLILIALKAHNPQRLLTRHLLDRLLLYAPTSHPSQIHLQLKRLVLVADNLLLSSVSIISSTASLHLNSLTSSTQPLAPKGQNLHHPSSVDSLVNFFTFTVYIFLHLIHTPPLKLLALGAQDLHFPSQAPILSSTASPA